MSAFGGKADIIRGKADIKKCPLKTQSGHLVRCSRVVSKSPRSRELPEGVFGCSGVSHARFLDRVEHPEIPFFSGHSDSGDIFARFCNPDAPHTELIATPRGCPPLQRCHRPQVGPSGVGCFVVDVTDFQLRPLASHVKPREPVCSVYLSVYADLAVTFWRMNAACNSADVTTLAHPPSEYPGRRSIVQQLAQSVGRERLSLRALPAFVPGHSVRLAKKNRATSAFGTKRTSLVAPHTSALGGKADMMRRCCDHLSARPKRSNFA
jgi:hypothetical protein